MLYRRVGKVCYTAGWVRYAIPQGGLRYAIPQGG